jgi:hypothetical protein
MAAVLRMTNGMIRTAKQLPEVARSAVGGGGALCLAWGFLRLVGWQYRKINKTNRIMLNVIEISYTGCPKSPKNEN